MKIRNKILTSALCLGMVASMASPVFAYNGENKGEHDKSTDDHQTTINYTVDETYQWEAPADITFVANSNNNEQTGTLAVTQNIIAGDKKLQIKITDGQEFKISNKLPEPNEVKRDYTVTGATKGSLSVGGTVLEVNAGTNTGSEELTFTLQEVAVQQAGTYTGVLNFEAAIVAK